ncbi:hypothetical protein SBU32_06170 [Klebsiella pneumoniae]|uniref:hypothetical protein n=1 Tax=Klebsiella pneumoniae TaxID=573 RepID=UPI00298CFCC8|nr:hypothetical protein [Klebsiella pneumoniae]MDW6138166.1 hypothetical protein [Klebsiella pneumoniae]
MYEKLLKRCLGIFRESHVFYVSRLSFFAWIDILFFKKIEPSTITATVSTITLVLAIYALTKVNEWIKIKKSEKAFERTTLFIDSVFRSKDLNHQCYQALLPIQPRIKSEDPILYMHLITSGREFLSKSKELQFELFAIRNSFGLWNIEPNRSDLLTNLITTHSDLVARFNIVYILIDKLERGERGVPESSWDSYIEMMASAYSDYHDQFEIFKGCSYNELFKIIK